MPPQPPNKIGLSPIHPSVKLGLAPNNPDLFVVYLEVIDADQEVMSLAIGSAYTEEVAIENAMRFAAALVNAISRVR